jgi:ubiquinone/menaquinone biosynthesis C-methylase UbiE
MAPSKAEIRATYERIADSFAATRREPWPEVASFIESLPRASRVLDLGCGNGRHARVLARRGHHAVAVDFSHRLLVIGGTESPEKAHRMAIEWVEGEATNLPFQDASFGAALCVALLHHLPAPSDRSAALSELRRVLRRGAPVLVSVWARDQLRFESLLASHPQADDVEVPWTMPDGTSVPRFYHLFREGELQRLIIESNLHGERFFRGGGNWFALARADG